MDKKKIIQWAAVAAMGVLSVFTIKDNSHIIPRKIDTKKNTFSLYAENIGYTELIYNGLVARNTVFQTCDKLITTGHSYIGDSVNMIDGSISMIEEKIFETENTIFNTEDPDIAIYNTNTEKPCLPIEAYNLYDHIGEKVKIISYVVDFMTPKIIIGEATLIDSGGIMNRDAFIRALPDEDYFYEINSLQLKGSGMSGSPVLHDDNIIGTLIAKNFVKTPENSNLILYQFYELRVNQPEIYQEIRNQKYVLNPIPYYQQTSLHPYLLSLLPMSQR